MSDELQWGFCFELEVGWRLGLEVRFLGWSVVGGRRCSLLIIDIFGFFLLFLCFPSYFPMMDSFFDSVLF